MARSTAPPSPADNRKSDRKAPRNQVNPPYLTKFQNQRQKTDTTLKEFEAKEKQQVERLKRLGRALVDFEHLRRIAPTVSERKRSEEEINSSQFGQYEQFTDDQEIEQTTEEERLPRSSPGGQGLGRQAAQAGTDYLKRQAGKAIRKQIAKKVSTEAIKKAITVFIAENPYAWLIIGGAVIVVFLIILMVFILIGLSNADPASAGTTPTVSYNRQSTIDTSALKATLAGRIDTAEKAQKVLEAANQLRSQLAGNTAALALLDEITEAAQAIIDAEPTDTELISQQAAIMKNRFRALAAQLQNGIPGSCDGIIPCLDVEPIGEARGTHCGRASAVMVLQYINEGFGETYFPASRHITNGPRGQRVNNEHVQSCLSYAAMNNYSPPSRRGWNYYSWKAFPGSTPTEQKNALIDAMVNSLNNNDPLIMYFKYGGTLGNSQHIVAVVGYDASDSGGTLIINNPNVHYTTPKTKFGDPQNKAKKLTRAHLIDWMSGDGDPYRWTVVMRDVYKPR